MHWLRYIRSCDLSIIILGNHKLALARRDLILLLCIIGGSRKVVGCSLVVRDIKTNFLLDSVDTEQAQDVENVEEGTTRRQL